MRGALVHGGIRTLCKRVARPFEKESLFFAPFIQPLRPIGCAVGQGLFFGTVPPTCGAGGLASARVPKNNP